jgi:hypothetical protein
MTPMTASLSPSVAPPLRHFVGRPNQHPVQPAFSPTSDRLLLVFPHPGSLHNPVGLRNQLSFSFPFVFFFLDNDGFPEIRFPATAFLDRNHDAGHTRTRNERTHHTASRFAGMYARAVSGRILIGPRAGRWGWVCTKGWTGPGEKCARANKSRCSGK